MSAFVGAIFRDDTQISTKQGQRDKAGITSMNRFAIRIVLAGLCFSPLAVSAQQRQSTDAPPATVQQAPPATMDQAPPQGAPPQMQGAPQQYQPAPTALTLPAGTIIY